MKYTFEFLTQNKVAITTKTKEEWEKVVGKLLEWTTWNNGNTTINISLFDSGCRFVDITDARIESGDNRGFYEHREYTIISAQEFLDDVSQPVMIGVDFAGGKDDTIKTIRYQMMSNKNKPKKVRIIKEFEGLPAVGSILEYDNRSEMYDPIEKPGTPALYNAHYIRLAIEAGYIEEVKEEWRSFVPKFGDRYFCINTCGEIVESVVRFQTDSERWKVGNCFKTVEHARLALEKFKKALKESHKDINK